MGRVANNTCLLGWPAATSIDSIHRLVTDWKQLNISLVSCHFY